MNSFRRRVMARKFNKIATLIGVTAFLAHGAVASAQMSGSDHGRRCARLGDGFVPVAGSDGCVRIGDHVRVDIPNGHAFGLQGSAPARGPSLARDGVNAASERYEVRPGLVGRQGGIFPR